MNNKLKKLLSLGLALFCIQAQAQDPGASRNFDARVEHNRSFVVTPGVAQAASVNALRTAVPGLSISYDNATGVTRTLSRAGGYLTEVDGRSARDVALEYARANASLLGLEQADLENYEITDEVRSRVSRSSHIYFRQTHLGLPVYNGQLQINMNKKGRVSSVNNAFMPAAAQAANKVHPTVSPEAAVSAVAGHLGVTMTTAPSLATAQPDPAVTTVLAAELSSEPIHARLMWLPVRRGQLRLVWNFQVHTLDGQHMYDMTVDAHSAKIWTRFDWVAGATYRAYPLPAESPNHLSPMPPADGRQLLVNPENAAASPFGWHDTDGVSGAEYTILRGNNVHAYSDVNATDTPNPDQGPDGGASLYFDSNYPIDLGTQEPATYRHASITNLFYWNNIIHDIQYQYGFDEAAGNFQVNNYGNGGLDGDAVNAEAQDTCYFPSVGYGCTNNAFFGTPADGTAPRMQMGIWDYANPDRDSSFDNGIIVHEYGHGISNRLVGGPSQVSCLQNYQQSGEGMADWWALVYTAKIGDQAADGRGIGTYPYNQTATGAGIRSQRYSTDPAVNTHTYASLASAPIYNSKPESHYVGEVWAQAAWEVYWTLVDKWGFGDLYDATGGRGNQRAMLYVNEGLQNTICSPTFTDVRDGIIQATVDNHSGQDYCRVWQAFAAFGLGTDAISGGPNSWTPTNGFATPAACDGTSPNDDFANAIVVTGSGGTVYSANILATAEPGEGVVYNGSNPAKSIWYQWTAPADAIIEFSTQGSDFDTVLEVYTGSSVDGLIAVSGNDDADGTLQSKTSFLATAGTTYRIAVDGYGGNTGYVVFNWLEKPPLNDAYQNAAPIDEGVTTGTLYLATLDGSSNAGGANADVWYAYTATAMGTLHLNTCGSQDYSGLDTVLSAHVNTGVAGTTANEIDANDDYTSGTDPSICDPEPGPHIYDSGMAFPVAPGDAILVRVSEYSGPEAAFRLTVNLDTDSDDDGVPDGSDAFPFDPTESVDTDGDGIGNNADTDDDNDTIPDSVELLAGRDPLVADWAVTAGGHSCALDDSGVVCWGDNTYNQGTVPALSNPVAVSAGGLHTCALDDSGVVCWGAGTTNTGGYELGQSIVPALSNPVAVNAGYYHTCALDDSGVVCWGVNGSGQSTAPALSNPVEVSAGLYHSCALDDSGVVCWGANNVGQTAVPALSNPRAVTAGNNHSCALDDSGVVCWGDNASGQTTVPVLSNPWVVSAGGTHSCALDDSGVVCWGDNGNGQTTVPALSNPVAVSAGRLHSCALDDSGVVCWGYNGGGQTTVPILAFDKDLDGLLDGIEDTNGNGVVDAGETDPLNPDTDGDGIADGVEDSNGNGMVDAGETDPRDPDTDADGVPDGSDVFPIDPTESVDTDGDGIGNNADTDDDNDTIPDDLDQAPGRDPLVADWAVSAGGHSCALDDSGVDCWGRNAYGQTTVPALSNPVAVNAGNSHTCALDDSGVVCWGAGKTNTGIDPENGQSIVPVLSNPVAVSAGGFHTCALDDSGVVCWGNNGAGQATVPALSNPVAVSAGQYHSCALDDSGVVCWGGDVYGQATVPALSNPVAVSAGIYHNCALDDSGIVCWGYSVQGQVSVPALSNPVAVSAGLYHSCALDDSGVVCWGNNDNGQTTVPALNNPVAVSAGNSHTCALDDSGVVCWGYNGDGQATVPTLAFDKDLDGLLDSVEDTNGNGVVDPGETNPLNPDTDGDGVGDGSDPFPTDPTESVDTDGDGVGNNADTDDDNDTIPDYLDQAPGRDPLVADWALSAGGNHTCALDDSGVACWGWDLYGQSTVPVLSNPVAVSGGYFHTCALDDSGVVCWGYNGSGQSAVPVLSNPVAVSAGLYHSCALDDSGVVCWGASGQSTVPVLSNPLAVSSGYYHSCALDDSDVVCWGDNGFGQTTVPALTNPVVVSAGGTHSCALDDSGVVCWGDNSSGETTVPALSNPVAVSSGFFHSCALDDSGVVCWGSNAQGQTTVPALSHPVAVSLGEYYSCALDDSGVVCWGANGYDQTTIPILAFDKDLDGLLDSVEDGNGNGVVDAGETDPLNPDTDGDGYTDGEEIAAGSDPLDENSTPVVVELGDLNADGTVDTADILIATRILAGSIVPSPEQFTAMDVAPLVGNVPSPDGQLNAGDLMLIQRKVLGLVSF